MTISGFDDLIDDALPYLGTEEIEATAGTTWQWQYLTTDHVDANVDMTSGYTGELSIRNAGGSEVLTATVTFPSSGIVRCKVLPAASVVPAGHYLHELTIVRTSDSAKIIAVGAGDAKIHVKAKVDP